MIHCMRKPTKFLGENKGADQLCGNAVVAVDVCVTAVEAVVVVARITFNANSFQLHVVSI